MTHVMAKGANISLAVAAVRAVLRWRAVPGGPDVDASALLLGADSKVRSDADFVFYNQPRHPTGVVRHLPKHRVPGGDEIADTVEVDLGKLPGDVDRVILAGSTEAGTFRELGGLRVLLYDTGAPAGAEPLAEFPVSDVEDVSALVCAELYRRGGAWKFRAVGQGYASGLGGLATDFGITVEDEAPEAAAPTQPAVPSTAPAPAPTSASPAEPGTFTLAPAVPATAAAPTTPPAPAATPAATPPQPAAPPTPPPAKAPTYGYPQQPGAAPGYPPAQHQPPYGYPPAPQPSYGYPPAAAHQPSYGYPPAPQPSYGYPQQPAPAVPQQAPPAVAPQAPAPVDPAGFVLPPQGPQFQPR